MTDLARELDRIAAAAFPAIENVHLDGWVLRDSGRAPWGRTRSVWTAHAGTSVTLPDRLAAVRRFYKDRHFPALFMVSDHSEPTELVQALRADGWAPWMGAQVQALIPLAELAGDRWKRQPAIRISTEAWSAASADLQGWDDDTTAANAELLARTPGEVVGVAAMKSNAIVGLGRGVVTEGWLGIFGMVTTAEHRGTGVGASVLAELIRLGKEIGATGAYLQVETVNTAALALYAAAGFEPVYEYDYWAPSDASSRDSYC